MTHNALQIWLSNGDEGVAATKIALRDGSKAGRLLVRGRSGGAFSTSYSFSWTPAVKALCVLACRTAASSHPTHDQDLADNEIILSGKKGSLAASLDYAISKKPNWLLELFGWDSDGRCLAGRYIRRSNPERKRGDTVSLSFDPVRLPSETISLFLEDTPLRDPAILRYLAACIEEGIPFDDASPASQTSAGQTRSEALGLERDRGSKGQKVYFNFADGTVNILEEVRRAKSLYLGPGPDSIEKLMLELYRDPRALRVVSYFQRPAVTFRPIELHQYLGMSNATIERSALALQRLEAKNLEMVEILQERSIWDIARLSADGSFQYFPPSVTSDHIDKYLAHYIHLLKNYSGITVVLTRATVPTFIVTYDFDNGSDNVERFSAYTGEIKDTIPYDYSVLVSHSRHRAPAEENTILKWALSHPLSVVDRAEVISRFEAVRNQLRNEGPLEAEDDLRN